MALFNEYAQWEDPLATMPLTPSVKMLLHLQMLIQSPISSGAMTEVWSLKTVQALHCLKNAMRHEQQLHEEQLTRARTAHDLTRQELNRMHAIVLALQGELVPGPPPSPVDFSPAQIDQACGFTPEESQRNQEMWIDIEALLEEIPDKKESGYES